MPDRITRDPESWEASHGTQAMRSANACHRWDDGKGGARTPQMNNHRNSVNSSVDLGEGGWNYVDYAFRQGRSAGITAIFHRLDVAAGQGQLDRFFDCPCADFE